MPSWSCNSAETFSITATSHRLTKTEATDGTCAFNRAATRRSIPRMYASAVARYCSREKRSVTLIGTPAKVGSSIAGIPALVPGNLDEEVRTACLRVEGFGLRKGPGGIVCQLRGDLERDPAIDTVGGLVNRLEEVGGLDQILDG